jgi:hypothetical protein
MYESQAFKALNLEAFRPCSLIERAFQALGRYEPFSKTSAVDHRTQKLISEAKRTKTNQVN